VFAVEVFAAEVFAAEVFAAEVFAAEVFAAACKVNVGVEETANEVITYEDLEFTATVE
jgi:hypothetical protein